MILIELALRMPVRVLHSGMFATRRIYRPLWSMFAPTAVSLVVIGVGVFLYPAGAIVIAIIASNAISIWITVHYTVRAYRLTGLWPKFGGRSIGTCCRRSHPGSASRQPCRGWVRAWTRWRFC